MFDVAENRVCKQANFGGAREMLVYFASKPMNRCIRASRQPSTACVCPSSVASPHPYLPSSSVILTKSHLGGTRKYSIFAIRGMMEGKMGREDQRSRGRRQAGRRKRARQGKKHRRQSTFMRDNAIQHLLERTIDPLPSGSTDYWRNGRGE